MMHSNNYTHYQDRWQLPEDNDPSLVPMIPYTHRSMSMDVLASQEDRRCRRGRERSNESSPRKQNSHRPTSGYDIQFWELPNKPNKSNSKSLSNLHGTPRMQTNIKSSKSRNDIVKDTRLSSPTKVRFQSQSNVQISKSNKQNVQKKSHAHENSKSPNKRSKENNNHNNKPFVIEVRTANNRRSDSSSINKTWVESNCGIVHMFVIATSLLTTIPLGIMSSQWEMHQMTCPLFVAAIEFHRLYWGNDNMSICYISAYLPLILLVSSLSISIFHGSVLHSVRTKGVQLSFMKKKSYAIIMTVINAIELILAIGIAGFITDGFRQTCLSFDLVPWETDRPQTCREGYEDRDDLNFVGNTYNRIIIAIIGSWLSVLLLLESTVICIWKTRICSM